MNEREKVQRKERQRVKKLIKDWLIGMSSPLVIK